MGSNTASEHSVCKGICEGQRKLRKAAEFGSNDALYNLGVAYYRGDWVGQDKAKGIHFYEKAATQGHVESRHNLGTIEGKKGNYNRAMRHYSISAKLGDKISVEKLKLMFMNGLATKKQYAEALKGYQDAVEEMKSHDRDEANRLNARKLSLRWKIESPDRYEAKGAKDREGLEGMKSQERERDEGMT